MHNAPAVGFPVGRSRFQGMLTGLFAICSIVTMALWAWQVDVVGWPQWLGSAGSLTVSVWLAWQWWHFTAGFLSWDGEVWTWAVDQQTTIVLRAVEFDFQHLLLLRLCSSSSQKGTWVWLERAFAPTRWLALRRAVFDVSPTKSDPAAGLVSQIPGTIRSAL